MVVNKQNGQSKGQCHVFDIVVHACMNPWFYCTLPIFAYRWFSIGSSHGESEMDMKLIYQCFVGYHDEH
jgi:hypothetical protein